MDFSFIDSNLVWCVRFLFLPFQELILILAKTDFILKMSTHKQKCSILIGCYSRNCYAGRLIASVFQEPYITMVSSKYVLHGKRQLPHCNLKVITFIFKLLWCKLKSVKPKSKYLLAVNKCQLSFHFHLKDSCIASNYNISSFWKHECCHPPTIHQ